MENAIDGRRKIMKVCLKKPWKSWIWNQYLPEDMTWKFGNIGILRRWNFGTLEPRNQEPWNQVTLKPRNFETRNLETEKLWNQETKKLWKQETNKPINLKPFFYFQVREARAWSHDPWTTDHWKLTIT